MKLNEQYDSILNRMVSLIDKGSDDFSVIVCTFLSQIYKENLKIRQRLDELEVKLERIKKDE